MFDTVVCCRNLGHHDDFDVLLHALFDLIWRESISFSRENEHKLSHKTIWFNVPAIPPISKRICSGYQLNSNALWKGTTATEKPFARCDAQICAEQTSCSKVWFSGSWTIRTEGEMISQPSSTETVASVLSRMKDAILSSGSYSDCDDWSEKLIIRLLESYIVTSSKIYRPWWGWIFYAIRICFHMFKCCILVPIGTGRHMRDSFVMRCYVLYVRN